MSNNVKTLNSFDDIGKMHGNFDKNGLTKTVIDEETLRVKEKENESSILNEVRNLNTFEDILKIK
jgi:hypothetical protein